MGHHVEAEVYSHDYRSGPRGEVSQGPLLMHEKESWEVQKITEMVGVIKS